MIHMFAVSAYLPGATERCTFTYGDAADAVAMADLLRDCWSATQVRVYAV